MALPNRAQLRELYFGEGSYALRFQGMWIIFDLCVIAFFIAAPFVPHTAVFYAIDYLIAALLLTPGRAYTGEVHVCTVRLPAAPLSSSAFPIDDEDASLPTTAAAAAPHPQPPEEGSGWTSNSGSI
jgi:hypothetical protein